MKFKYGDTLRIRNDLYTILGKIRYIDTRRRIWCKYKLVKHKNNAEFWIRWNKNVAHISLQSCAVKRYHLT